MQEKVIAADENQSHSCHEFLYLWTNGHQGKHLHEAESSCKGHERVPSVPPSQQVRSSFRGEGKGF